MGINSGPFSSLINSSNSTSDQLIAVHSAEPREENVAVKVERK